MRPMSRICFLHDKPKQQRSYSFLKNKKPTDLELITLSAPSPLSPKEEEGEEENPDKNDVECRCYGVLCGMDPDCILLVLAGFTWWESEQLDNQLLLRRKGYWSSTIYLPSRHPHRLLNVIWIPSKVSLVALATLSFSVNFLTFSPAEGSCGRRN